MWDTCGLRDILGLAYAFAMLYNIAMYSVQCTIYNINHTLYTVQYTVYSV